MGFSNKTETPRHYTGLSNLGKQQRIATSQAEQAFQSLLAGLFGGSGA